MSAEHVTDILILGAGFSGLAMAMEARRRGFDDIAILEKADDVGGTWRENTYPGVACDVPSHLYSFANHLNPDWSTCYAGGGEIWAYMKNVAQREGLYELCRFGRTFRSAVWDGARWQVETEEGERWSARVLVSGLGALHIPKTPDIPGVESFPGTMMHSARWDHSVDLAGRRVAVIGSGASAVQFVPAVAQTAARLTVFQRTAPYVLPRPDGPIRPWVRALYRRFPILPRLRRRLIFKFFEMRHATFRGEARAVRIGMKFWRRALEKSFPDPADQARLTPDYRIGCKRVLSSNDWYPALARDNVDLVTSGLERFEGRTLIARDGTRVEADVVVWGTGFHVADSLARMDFRGVDGRPIAEAWKNGLEAHLGTALDGFPNLFILLGPHTGLGHNSVVLMIEAQAEHVGRLLAAMRAEGREAVAPKPAAQAAFEAEMERRLEGMVWQDGGCSSWYQDADGKLTTLWPGTVAEYQTRMAASGLEQYQDIPPAPSQDRIPQEA